jgi:hypothetical protein
MLDEVLFLVEHWTEFLCENRVKELHMRRALFGIFIEEILLEGCVTLSKELFPSVHKALEGSIELQPLELDGDAGVVVENASKDFLQVRALNNDGMKVELPVRLHRQLVTRDESMLG